MLADAMLENRAIQGCPLKIVVTPAARRSVVAYLRTTTSSANDGPALLSGCTATVTGTRRYRKTMTRSGYACRSWGKSGASLELRGCTPCCDASGYLINHKRTERLYREEGLSLRLKKRRKRTSHVRSWTGRAGSTSTGQWISSPTLFIAADASRY